MAQRHHKEHSGEHVVKRRGVWVRGVSMRWYAQGADKIMSFRWLSFTLINRGTADVC